MFEIEPWRVLLRQPELGTLAAVESCFALANGHMGLRGTLEEGEPRARPGTYLSGVFEERPLPHAEAGYGSISEVFDGDPPHTAGGCIAQAWSVGEVFRAWEATAGRS